MYPGSNFHNPPSFFLPWLQLFGLCYSHCSVLFFFLLFQLPLFFSSSSPLRYSRSGNAATLARLTNVESSPFFCAPARTSSVPTAWDFWGVWKMARQFIVGTQGFGEWAVWLVGPFLVRRDCCARLSPSLASTPRCRVWRLVGRWGEGSWQDDNKVSHELQRALANKMKERREGWSLTLLDHTADIQQLNGCRGPPKTWDWVRMRGG